MCGESFDSNRYLLDHFEKVHKYSMYDVRKVIQSI